MWKRKKTLFKWGRAIHTLVLEEFPHGFKSFV
jgi:hypothetical protein